MVSDDIRPFARRINRLWSNIIFQGPGDSDCRRLFGELYEEMYGTDTASRIPRAES